MNILLLVIISFLFFLIIASYSIKRLDFVAISLLCMFISATLTGIVNNIEFDIFVGFIEFEPIIIILSMSIITKIAQDSNILEYVAVKLFKISKGNRRTFFYLLCIITTFLASIISDVVVILILAPIVIRLCHFLKIRAGTYLLGMSIVINIGSILSPFSSSENLIISSAFELDTLYFIQFYWIFSFFLLFLTIFLIDRLILRNEPEIQDQQREYVLDLINAEILIKNKKMFYFNSIAILITIVLFVVLPLLYLTAIISTLILVLVNQKYTKKQMGELLKKVEWEIIFFFISLYVIIGCLLEVGFREIFESIPFESVNIFILVIVILVIVSLISGFVANTPTALIFIPIIDSLINTFNFSSIPLLFSFIIGINIGGNILPQGSACDMVNLKIARDSGVENFNYRRLLKVGGIFALLHILCSLGYGIILTFFII